MDKEPTTKELTPKQEIFCRNFASQREFFGNGVQSYLDAYNLDSRDSVDYETAKANAYKLLTNTHICERIAALLDLAGFNDNNVDKQLAMVINQSVDLKSKVAAIKEYNSLKARIKNSLEVNVPDEDKKALRDIVTILKKKEEPTFSSE